MDLSVVFPCLNEEQTLGFCIGEVRNALESTGISYEIVVADNGVGYNLDLSGSVAPGSGFGLFSIRERLDLIGGGLEIICSPGNGCCCTVTTPLGTGRTLADFKAIPSPSGEGINAKKLAW